MGFFLQQETQSIFFSYYLNIQRQTSSKFVPKLRSKSLQMPLETKIFTQIKFIFIYYYVCVYICVYTYILYTNEILYVY